MTQRLLIPDLVLPMARPGEVLTDAGVVVDGSRIAAVGPVDQLRSSHPEADEMRLEGQLLMPGLVNAHHHSGVLRGTAEHLPVWEWLQVHIDPMHRVLRPEEAKTAAYLCYAEGLLAGTTTVVDMWRYMDGCAEAAEQLGNRLVTVNYVGAHPQHDYIDTLDDNERMLQTWGPDSGRGEGRIIPWVGLEHPFYADEQGLARAVKLAQDYGTGLYTHCSESELDIAEFQRRYGRRPVHALADLGFFDVPRTLLAHAIWLDESEIEFLAGQRAGTAHNPVSNMKLASGAARVTDLRAAGIPVGLGTDGEKENNNLDMFEEMKVASLLAKLRSMDAAALDSWEVLEMATMGGARALGLEDRIGSLEPGKQADLIAVRTDTVRMTPLLPEGPYANIHHNLVHAVLGSDVSLTMVDGRILTRDGELLTAQLPELIADARQAVPGLFERRSAYLDAVDAGREAPVTQRGSEDPSSDQPSSAPTSQSTDPAHTT